MKAKIQIKPAVVTLLLAVGAMLVGGCASVGPPYQRVEKIPDGMGVVYLYRPSHLVGGGAAYKVKAGDTPIVTMYNGGYYPYFTKPGEVELSAKTESTSSVTVDVKPAESQYVKCTVGVGFFIGRPHLMVVAPEQAEPEIVKCRLLTAKP
jgi:hypothetical protein